MKTKIISAISAIALAAAVMGPVQAQDQGAGADAAPQAETGAQAGAGNDTTTGTDAQAGGGINQDALTSEQVQMVQQHCAALLAAEGEQPGAGTGPGAAADAAAPGDPAQPSPSATDSLAQDPLTESELNDPTGTAQDVGDGDITATDGAGAGATTGGGAGADEGQTGTSAQGQTSADAQIVGHAAVPAGADTEPFDLEAITAEDCIQAGIVG